jgi:hypothetical protein
MGGVEYLLVRPNARILEFVLDGVEPIVGVQGFGRLGECWRVGVLEIPKLVAGFLIIIATTIVVVVGDLRKVLKGCKVSLALGACGFAFFKHEPQHLLHARLKRVVADCLQLGLAFSEPFWREVVW